MTPQKRPRYATGASDQPKPTKKRTGRPPKKRAREPEDELVVQKRPGRTRKMAPSKNAEPVLKRTRGSPRKRMEVFANNDSDESDFEAEEEVVKKRMDRLSRKGRPSKKKNKRQAPVQDRSESETESDDKPEKKVSDIPEDESIPLSTLFPSLKPKVKKKQEGSAESTDTTEDKGNAASGDDIINGNIPEGLSPKRKARLKGKLDAASGILGPRVYN